ncbi:DUF2730 family protein [Orbaceae bacterium ESL0721]|nr:DUF2730 family protein [Orbaceae bacterium ESL0721]
MFDFIHRHWTIITSLGSLIVGIIIVLLTTKFAKREELNEVICEVAKLKKEIVSIKGRIDSLPTKDDFHKLNIEISGLRGDIKEIKPELAGVKQISDMLLENELKERHV